MPGRKRKGKSNWSSDAVKQARRRRENETAEQKAARLKKDRERKHKQREDETEEERLHRLKEQAERTKDNINDETEEERLQRLQRVLERRKSEIATETEEERSQRLQRVLERRKSEIATETEEERSQRLQRVLERRKSEIATETEEERSQRLQRVLERRKSEIATETEEERSQRLQRVLERRKSEIATETEEERSQRLQRVLERRKSEIATETEEERSQRLQRVLERRKSEIATETEEERLNRLKDMAVRTKNKTMNETGEERSERLKNMSIRNKNRITTETDTNRYKRLKDQTERNKKMLLSETEQQQLQMTTPRTTIARTHRPLSADVGHMDKICAHCRAYRFHGETANFCCMSGKVNMANLPPLPHELQRLFSSNQPDAREFRKNIRQYNCLFQMTSFGGKEVFSQKRGWNPSVIIQGQIHHYIGSLIPEPHKQAQFLQIYFLDPQDSVKLRMDILENGGIQRDIVELLEGVFRTYNPYVRSLTLAKEQIKDIPEARIVIDPNRRPSQEHERRFNAQAANEVAVILENNNSPEVTSRHVVLKQKGGKVQIISESHRSYDCLQYVIFFPWGEDGWHSQLQLTNQKKLTAMRYYSFRIQNHEHEFNHILRGGRLFQQYLVDMAAKMEGERLNFIRTNQVSLRSSTYKGLTDALNDNDDLQNIGKRVILSSTFVGGPRYMMERCQDAMMYIRKYGNASFFITMTCNPDWPEIQENLFLNQKPYDRPDLIARVFELKRKLFLKYLTGPDGLLGRCIAFIISTEYQKRGLPHLHCLLWLDEETKPRPNVYDQYVQAEIPNPLEDAEGHALVLRHMIHGPNCCVTSPCWKNGACSKRYPKSFAEHTMCGEDSYPVYRRRSVDMGGFFGYKEGREGTPITSEWVVPHNMQLLKIFNCHLNVEVCTSVKSIKYVVKYTLKGSDQAMFGLKQNDEIAQYLAGRYIGPSEAVSSILGFPVHERDPPVVRLQVHLPDEQHVYFQDTAGLTNTEMCKTTLTQFMKLNTDDHFARTLFYAEVPRYFTWANKQWQRRKVGKENPNHPGRFEANVLGRVYTVSPRCGELYYLRLLLHHVKGPQSFDDLKKHDEKTLATFKTACIARGLLQTDDHWRQTLLDAENTRLPRAMRDLFVVLLTHEEIVNPKELWEQFKNSMSQDYLKADMSTRTNENPNHHDQALLYIQEKLEAYGKRLADYSLPTPTSLRYLGHNEDITKETSYCREKLSIYVREKAPMLNCEQLAVYNYVLECLEENKPSMIFIDAPGGTGKTFLINLIISLVRAKGDIALAVASSGIAATLMPGGRTAHSRFKIPIIVDDNSVCNIETNSNTAGLLRQTKLIVWDECSMARRECFEAVDRTLRDVCHKDVAFGGIITICCGDFRQLLPVVKRGNEVDIQNASIKKSYLWELFTKFNLNLNMRLEEGEIDYSRFLLNVGEGKVPTNENGEIELPEDMVLNNISIEQCMKNIYPSFEEPKVVFSKRCILVPLNENLRTINSMCIREFPGQLKEYFSFNSVIEGTDSAHFPTEFLDSVELSGLPPHRLELKIGSPIALLRNLDPPRLCNGTRLIIQALHNNLIVAKILIGQYQNETVLIPRITVKLTEGDDIPLQRTQFPVQSCFAMTIHKAQGQTMENVLIYLEKPVFQHGQLYVALSRGRRKENVKVLLKDSIFTRNVVIRSILQ
ncbi:uncharacterized protein LOC131950184 [Physella acuta]|uniref:uncharacterized protein LOC131950184 n=1 Tax=Physella acuta TaxID=109671 RepID=UPI0027DBA151|nr:uncharacterized protein LOC131950184 [Physella acuta]